MTGIEFSNPLPNPHGPSGNINRPANSQEASASKADNKTVESNSVGQVSSWNAKLNELPEVRPEMVEKGKALIQQPDYPNRAQIEALAGKLLAQRDS